MALRLIAFEQEISESYYRQPCFVAEDCEELRYRRVVASRKVLGIVISFGVRHKCYPACQCANEQKVVKVS